MHSVYSLALIIPVAIASQLRHPAITTVDDIPSQQSLPVCDLGLTTCSDNRGCCPSGQSCTTSGNVPICKADCSSRAQSTGGTGTSSEVPIPPTEPAWPSHTTPVTSSSGSPVSGSQTTTPKATSSLVSQSQTQQQATSSSQATTTATGAAQRIPALPSQMGIFGHVLLGIIWAVL